MTSVDKMNSLEGAEKETGKPADSASLRPLPAATAKPGKSILRKAKTDVLIENGRRLSTVKGQTMYNALSGRIDNLDMILDTTDQGLIDTSLDAHKLIVENLARKVQESAPRYAIKTLYNEYLPCLKKVNDHYHRIAVGATAEHPSLRDCDARLTWAREYTKKTNDII